LPAADGLICLATPFGESTVVTRGVYPEDAAEMLEISDSDDKQLHHVDGEHFGFPMEGASERNPREAAARTMSDWPRQRFMAR
jgi:hypothetical protein